jgi:hypothetical protein
MIVDLSKKADSTQQEMEGTGSDGGGGGSGFELRAPEPRELLPSTHPALTCAVCFFLLRSVLFSSVRASLDGAWEAVESGAAHDLDSPGFPFDRNQGNSHGKRQEVAGQGMLALLRGSRVYPCPASHFLSSRSRIPALSRMRRSSWTRHSSRASPPYSQHPASPGSSQRGQHPILRPGSASDYDVAPLAPNGGLAALRETAEKAVVRDLLTAYEKKIDSKEQPSTALNTFRPHRNPDCFWRVLSLQQCSNSSACSSRRQLSAPTVSHTLSQQFGSTTH